MITFKLSEKGKIEFYSLHTQTIRNYKYLIDYIKYFLINNFHIFFYLFFLLYKKRSNNISKLKIIHILKKNNYI